MCGKFGLLETWMEMFPNDDMHSFYSGVHGTYSRLDGILISYEVKNWVKGLDIRMIKITDHAPVSAFLQVGHFNRPYN